MSNPITEENRALFAKALNEAITLRMEEEMEGCVEDASTSLRHKLIMKKIAKGKCTCREDLFRMKKRGIMIAIIAAMLALTSCTLAIVYREKIGGFIEHIFEDHVAVEAENGETDDYPKEIEKVYEFTYIPEGYELKSEKTNFLSVIRIYANSKEKELKLKQLVKASIDFKNDSENSYSKEFNIKGIDIYCRNEALNTYVWESNDYIFQIHSDDNISKEELTKIILGVK